MVRYGAVSSPFEVNWLNESVSTESWIGLGGQLLSINPSRCRLSTDI
jgi:hypothetical protein